MPSSNRLAILTYHSLDDSGSVVSVAPALFADQMDALAATGVQSLTLIAAWDHRERVGRWPDNAVVITFDDGYANVCTHALPTMTRHGFVATIFVISSHVGKKNDWAARPPRLPECDIATWEQIAALDRAGWEIAAHTHTHPDLRHCTADDVQKEYRLCNETIASNIGRAPRTLAYPFGGYSPSAVEYAQSQYCAAVTTTLQRAGRQPSHLLPRIDMFYAQSPEFLTEAVRGRRDGYLAIRHCGRWIKQRLS